MFKTCWKVPVFKKPEKSRLFPAARMLVAHACERQGKGVVYFVNLFYVIGNYSLFKYQNTAQSRFVTTFCTKTST